MPPPNKLSRLTRHIGAFNDFKGLFQGFTLAEVLITLGIIGVVAAMTMPSLIQDKQNTERISQLKKVYSTLSQAYLQAVSEKGTPDEWGMTGMYDETSHYIFATAFRPYLKLAKDCIDIPENAVREECGISDSLYLYKNARSVILIDGTLVTFRIYTGACTANYSGSSGNNALKNTCGAISIDLNGKRLPNKNGEDRFLFYFTKNGLVPFGIKKSSLEFEKAYNRKIELPYPTYSPGNMYGCTAWVIYNENMDYLKCDDLSWDGKIKCR